MSCFSTIIVSTLMISIASSHFNEAAINHQGSINSNNDVPIYAQCHPINESYSPVCPETLGPPCPYCYTNWMNDYIDPITTNITISYSMKLNLYNMISNYANEIITYWPPNILEYPTTDYNIFTGVGGLGQIFLRLYQHIIDIPNINNKTSTNNLKKIYLNYAKEYLSFSLNLLPSFNKQEYSSYFYGNIGIWFLSSIYQQFNNNTIERDNYLKLINQTFELINSNILNGTTNTMNLDDGTLDSGVTGLLYSGHLINEWFEYNNIKSDYTKIDINYLKTIVNYILKLGETTGKSNGKDYLQFEFPEGCYFIGQGHGSGGAVRMMLEFAYKNAPELLTDPNFIDPIERTLDYYVSVQFDDGNVACMNCTAFGFPTQADIKIQWCHGAPGFIGTFSKAALVFENINKTKSSIYFNAALKAANATWDRGLLAKGLTYCHGVGGNTYMLLDLYNNLRQLENNRINSGIKNILDIDKLELFDIKNNLKYTESISYLKNQTTWRAKQFVNWVLNPYNIEREHVASPDASMFQGNHGIIMLLTQLLQNDWPQIEHCMPGWNACV